MTDCIQKRLSVSVIIPTYNRAAFIAAAIDSALNQTRPPDEVLVIDDGSTDQTPRILSRYESPVRVIRQPNRGRSAARNVGLRAVETDAVIFLDSDDLFMPRCIERCVRELEARPKIGVVYSDAYLCDRLGERIGLYGRDVPGPRPSGMILDALTRRNIPTISSMVRRSQLGDIKFDESLECAEDYDFWRQLAARCPFLYLDEPLLCYRFHDAMTVANRHAETSAGEIEVQRRILQMPEFSRLSRNTRSRAFCMHGMKHAMLGATGVARSHFWQAIRTSPAYPGGYALMLLSLLGARSLRYTIVKRRQLAGNRFATHGDVASLSRHRRSPQPSGI
jgi:glycosyltransferase involved in cell wall biosynthesis